MPALLNLLLFPFSPPFHNSQGGIYSTAWRGHVWAHLPFYSILLPAFLELAYSQLAYSGKSTVREVYRVRPRCSRA
jgi:hypothetical protein